MDKVEVKITFEEESGMIVNRISTDRKYASDMERTAKGIAVTLMWLKMEARKNKGGMLVALSELMSEILKDDDEPQKREIKIDRKEFMRQLRELKEEAENE